MRHPMYTAIFTVAVAICLLTANWLIILLTIPVQIAGYVLRVPREEAMMLESFGEEYRAYMRRTGHFLPRLIH